MKTFHQLAVIFYTDIFKAFLFTYLILHITPEYPYNLLSCDVSSYTLRSESDLLTCPK